MPTEPSCTGASSNILRFWGSSFVIDGEVSETEGVWVTRTHRRAISGDGIDTAEVHFHRLDDRNIDYNIAISSAGLNLPLSEREYRSAARLFFDRIDEGNPTLYVTAGGRACHMSLGNFVVERLVVEDDEIIHIALHFDTDCEGGPIAGCIRYTKVE